MTRQLADPLAPTPPSSRWTGAIRALATIAGVVTLAAGTISVVGYFKLNGETRTTSFDAAMARVVVTNNDGDVVVRTGTAGSAATVYGRSENSFRTAVHRESITDGVLNVTGDCQGAFILADSCSVFLEITVPPGTAVEVRTSFGDVSVLGTTATVKAHSSAGDLRVARARGPIDLSTNTGDISGESLAGGKVTGDTKTGDIRFDFTATPDRIFAKTRAGDIRISVPDDQTGYRVQAQHSLGDQHIDVPTDPASTHVIDLSTRTGDIRLALS